MCAEVLILSEVMLNNLGCNGKTNILTKRRVYLINKLGEKTDRETL